MRIITAAAIAAALTGCATTEQPILQQTASGRPEVLLKGTSVAAAKSKLMERCAMRGMAIEEQGSSTIVCTKTLDGVEAVGAQMLVGNSYSTPAVRKSSFLITQRGDDAFVMSTGHVYWTQMVGGQVRTQPVANNTLHNSTQQFLDSL